MKSKTHFTRYSEGLSRFCRSLAENSNFRKSDGTIFSYHWDSQEREYRFDDATMQETLLLLREAYEGIDCVTLEECYRAAKRSILRREVEEILKAAGRNIGVEISEKYYR